MNCISCKDKFYKLNGTNNCYNKSTLNESYYFKDNIFFICDENCLTCSEGKNKTSNNCLSCDVNKELYLVEKINNCEYKNYSGYYLYMSDDIQILKECYYNCKICNGSFSFNNITKLENHNCIECKENFKKLSNGSFPNNCYEKNIEIEDGITNLETTNIKIDLTTSSKLEANALELDLSTSKIEFTEKLSNIICYNTCLICNELQVFNESENTINNNCQKCKEGYYFKLGTKNCYNHETIEKGYYLDIKEHNSYWKECYLECETCNKSGNIMNMNCLSCKSNLLISNGNCVSNCPNNSYKFDINNTCLEKCPNDFEINHQQNKCIKKPEQTTSSEFISQINKTISDFINSANSSTVINGSDFIAVIMSSGNMDPKEQLKKKKEYQQ